MALKIKINAEEIASQFNDIKDEVRTEVENAVKNLATQTHTYVVDELANTKLKSTRETFLKNCKYDEVAPGVHVVSILEPAMFIEEGFKEPFDMKPGMLASNKAVTGKNGHKYLNVPFKHSQAPSKLAPTGLDIRERLLDNLDKENKKRKLEGKSKIPYLKPLEFNPDGSPKLGRVHTFNWGGKYPTAKAATKDLERVSVYQSLDKSTGKVRRDWFTFRTVTNNPRQQGKWIHPPTEGKHFLEDAEKWFLSQWESEVLPKLLTRWRAK